MDVDFGFPGLPRQGTCRQANIHGEANVKLFGRRVRIELHDFPYLQTLPSSEEGFVSIETAQIQVRGVKWVSLVDVQPKIREFAGLVRRWAHAGLVVPPFVLECIEEVVVVKPLLEVPESLAVYHIAIHQRTPAIRVFFKS